MNTSKENDENLKLRKYLLGIWKEAEIEEIEERLMLDRDYLQKLLLEEEELIEDYINGELDADEIKLFKSHFLIPVERRERVKLERLLRNHLNQEILETPGGNLIASKWKDFKRFFLSPIPATISILAILVISFLLWNFYDTNSDVRQKALASLNKAYAAERPLESRISEFGYAPFNKTRNQNEAGIDWIEQERAQRILLDEVSENATAENQHSLARLYLAKKEFDKALQLLEEAQKKSPQDAKILNDIGTVYLEKSKLAAKDEEKLTLVADAVASFDKALVIDPDLLPARFNKAIATEVYLPNRARQAWQEYLERDQTSDWANEARNRLEALNKQETQIISTAEELELAFFEAYREQNDEKAFQIVSQNRELIYEKYLPQRFAMALVSKKKTKEIEKSSF